MYVKGIAYLAQSQNGTGCWDTPFGNEPAVVGLSILSILAHGEDPNYGPYKETIHNALDYILNKQDKDTGYIGTSMYNHGFSTLALAEAYGYVHDDRIGPALQKAVDLILSSQSRNPSPCVALLAGQSRCRYHGKWRADGRVVRRAQCRHRRA